LGLETSLLSAFAYSFKRASNSASDSSASDSYASDSFVSDIFNILYINSTKTLANNNDLNTLIHIQVFKNHAID